MTDNRAVALKAKILAGKSTAADCCRFIMKASSALNTHLSQPPERATDSTIISARDKGTHPAAGSQHSALGTAES